MLLTLRQERIQRGWTQNYVAEKTGLSLTAIQKIETGQRKPSYDVLVKLEDLFGLTHRQLFGAATPGERSDVVIRNNQGADCPHCKERREAGANFCGRCGKQLKEHPEIICYKISEQQPPSENR